MNVNILNVLIDKMNLRTFCFLICFVLPFFAYSQDLSKAEEIGIPVSNLQTRAIFEALERQEIVLSKTVFRKNFSNDFSEISMFVWPESQTVEIWVKRNNDEESRYIYSYQYGLLVSGETLPLKNNPNGKGFTRLVINKEILFPETLMGFLGMTWNNKFNISKMLFGFPTNIYQLLMNETLSEEILIPQNYSILDREIFLDRIKDVISFFANISDEEMSKNFELGIGNLHIKTKNFLIEEFNFKAKDFELSANSEFVKSKDSKEYVSPSYVEEYDLEHDVGKNPEYGFVFKKDANSLSIDINSDWSKYLYLGNKDVPQCNLKITKLNGKLVGEYSLNELNAILNREASVVVEFLENGKSVSFRKFDLKERRLINRAKLFLKSDVLWDKK